MGAILKNIGIYDDIMSEESDLFVDLESSAVSKQIGKMTPHVVKDVLKDMGKL